MPGGVYYHEMSNGWTVILTLPINSILMGEKNIVIYVIAAIALVLFLVVALMTVQDILRNRQMKRRMTPPICWVIRFMPFTE